jgi:biopolymer transport protein TolQ
MTNQAGFLSYFIDAGLIVKLVMLILMAASVISWTLIIQRSWFYKKNSKNFKDFIASFWNSADLGKLYMQIDKERNIEGVSAIFYSGFKEFVRMRKQGKVLLPNIERVMQISCAKEAELLEQHLPIFASIGSIAPFVGLFGTVWGIMSSFQALGQAQQATIGMVAPGISEALIATALGLFTAIPAVLAYNRYSTKVNSLLNKYELFQEELIALISEQTESNIKG